MTRVQVRLLRLFNLRADQDSPQDIDDTIRAGTAVGGGNLWGLIGAIFIASIGLNVNATAVIIGAMLISPLMGPIVAVGYGVGIKDFDLIRLALRNWLIFTLISLITATTYFALTPLNVAQSELLARTSPNLWDVLVAFIGGGIGMIAATRQHSSNVVPGVAIATALMPPLCTAGFGLATGNMAFFGGALYLFTINSVFIAFASLAVVKLLRLPARNVAAGARWRTRLLIGVTVMVTAIPSGFLALDLVQQKLFEQTAQQILDSYAEDSDAVLLARDVQVAERKVVLTLGAQGSAQAVQAEMARQFKARGYADANIKVRTIGAEGFDVGQITQALQKELLQNSLTQLREASARIQALEAENQRLGAVQAQHPQLLQELAAWLPEAQSLAIGAGSRWQRGDVPMQPAQLLSVTLDKPVEARLRARLNDWLTARYPQHGVHVEWINTAAPTRRKALPRTGEAAAAQDSASPTMSAGEDAANLCAAAPVVPMTPSASPREPQPSEGSSRE